MSVTAWLREHLLSSFGVWTEDPEKLPGLEELQQTEWSTEFEMCMRRRLIIGAFRYGRFQDPKKWRYDLLGGLGKKLQAYQKTGNRENLVDIANYALLEFVRPSHVKAHFAAEDDHIHCPST